MESEGEEGKRERERERDRAREREEQTMSGAPSKTDLHRMTNQDVRGQHNKEGPLVAAEYKPQQLRTIILNTVIVACVGFCILAFFFPLVLHDYHTVVLVLLLYHDKYYYCTTITTSITSITKY